jgi:serine palmitoyltransferase
MAVEGRLLQDTVDEALAQGVWITGARQLRGEEAVNRVQVSRLLFLLRCCKECERAAEVVKAAAVKVLTKRK